MENDTIIEFVITGKYTKSQVEFFATGKGWISKVPMSEFSEEEQKILEWEIDNPISAHQFVTEHIRNLLIDEISKPAISQIEQYKDSEKRDIIKQTKTQLAASIEVSFEEVK